MDQFFEKHNMPKLTEEIDGQNKPMYIKEIESIIDNLPNKEVPGPDEFTG